MATQIYLVRHGETEWTLSGRHTSHTDLPLTAEGERGAAKLGRILHGTKFTQVFSSPLQRARRTCALAGFGATVRSEPDIQEWDYGDYEGRTTAEIRAEQPGWNVFENGCPRGETVAEISERADTLLARIRAMDGTIALFSHGHFLQVLAARWIDLPVQKGQHFSLDTASIGILGYEHSSQDIPAIALWNAGINSDWAQPA